MAAAPRNRNRTHLFRSDAAVERKQGTGRQRETLVKPQCQRIQFTRVDGRGNGTQALNSAQDLNWRKDIAASFLRLAALPTSQFDRLCRYEHLLWRQARQIVITLKSQRRRRRPASRSNFPFSLHRRTLQCSRADDKWFFPRTR